MNKYLPKDNPKGLKSGDRLILIRSSNGIPKSQEGDIVTVRTQPTATARSFGVTSSIGQNWTLYYSGSGGNADVFRLVTRKEEASYLRDKIEEMEKEISAMTQRAFELEEFETEEEYVAYKLSKILEAGSNPKAIDEILRTMKEILRTMKESNLL